MFLWTKEELEISNQKFEVSLTKSNVCMMIIIWLVSFTIICLTFTNHNMFWMLSMLSINFTLSFGIYKMTKNLIKEQKILKKLEYEKDTLGVLES